jgi:hypothetical protein
MRSRVILLTLFFLYAGTLFPQCCSTGSPVGASVYVGVLAKNSIRIIGYYRHNYSDIYYQGTSKTTENNQLSHSLYNFTGLTLGYGITKRLTVETDFGYFINKTQVFNTIDYQETGYGMANGGVTVKYGTWLKPSKQIELTLGTGFRYPFSTTPQQKDGVQLSRDVQPSTNAWAVSGMLFFNKGFPSVTMRLFTINRYDHNFEDPLNYKYGDVLMNSVFVSKVIVKNLMAVFQVRSEYRQPDEDTHEVRQNTGNWLILAVPQLSYAIAGKWNLSALWDIPVYKDYTGKQLTPTYSFAVSLSRDINLSKSPKAVKDIKSAN